MSPMKRHSTCNYPRCDNRTPEAYCKEHRKEKDAAYDARRDTSNQRGYGSRWQKARAAYLRRHPLCAECKRQGLTVAATVVDHIIPHRGNKVRFWNSDNWQSLCASCHNKKTARGE